MNIAFTSILLFLLIAPGLIFIYSYNATKLSIKNPDKNIVTELSWSIIPAFCIQILLLFFVEYFTSFKVNFEVLGNLILGINHPEVINKSFLNIEKNIYLILFYNLFAFVFSIFLGIYTRKLVRKYKLDTKYISFRFTNKWHYIFSGECLDFPNIPDEFEQITNRIADILCKVNGKTVLYTGEIYDYYIDSFGQLESIHLRFPCRRFFDNDIGGDERYYEIPSKFIIIPYNEIINLNIRYFHAEEITTDEIVNDSDIIQ